MQANDGIAKEFTRLNRELKQKEKENRALERELQRKEKALAETAALLVLRKKTDTIWGGSRGRLIPTSDREESIELIEEAVISGAKLCNACKILNLTERTYYRWKQQIKLIGSTKDLRPTAKRPVPANKLSVAEKQEILNIVKKKEYASLSPAEIVPSLANEGIYIASEASFYRVLKEYSLQHHRGRMAVPVPVSKPLSTHCATAPNRVWMWDIAYLNGPIKGSFYYLYLISDLFSRKIVAWEVWDNETAIHASELIRRAVLSEKISAPRRKPLILHSDNGSPMNIIIVGLNFLHHINVIAELMQE